MQLRSMQEQNTQLEARAKRHTDPSFPSRSPQSLGPACDIYGLGAVLYEMLTGRPPFRAASPVDTIMQVIANDPVPPRLLNPKVDPDLETICLKCLEKDPLHRYGTAEAVADDLNRYLQGESISARSFNVLDRIAPTAVPRSSIIISDEALSAETNYRTEFVAVLSNQPQGGFITRKPTPVAVAGAQGDDGYGFFFQRSPGPQPGNPPQPGWGYQGNWGSQQAVPQRGGSQTVPQRGWGSQTNDQYFRREQQGW